MKIEKEKQVLFHEIRCNRCGKKLPLTPGGVPQEDFVEVDKLWGYYSGQDGVRIRFDLCENCVNEWIQTFEIPPEKEDAEEF
ncbi:MAG: hypothetical protein HFI93_06070 [Lachnospiraceae bacterium]|nr:hypothetical protein [Lachnospiraceae bacterium]